eukprot:TRINITY_DN29037_c0_g1_i1.p1 TRINITY_DN29037_c0_g1~~TRINITY_DN29037_c0_g1_i1.p1  ORF type:complete len:965 (-),score=138.10 TRINITY_DN29037_c0_g1_i1:106-3000(-)
MQDLARSGAEEHKSSQQAPPDCGAQDGGPLVAFRSLPRKALAAIFSSDDEAVCAALHGRVLAVGTRQGRVWCLFGGKHCGEVAEVGSHSANVTDVSFDASGTYVASSSSDGTVAVWPVSCASKTSDGQDGAEGWQPDKQHWIYSHARPVFSVALCPDYKLDTASTRAVCFGGEDGRLMLNLRGAFASKSLVVHAGEGHILAVRWRGTLIAWADVRGIKVVDIDTYQKVAFVPWPSAAEARLFGSPDVASQPRCSLTWSADEVLLIGFRHCVMVAEIRQKQGGPRGVRFARVAHSFQFESLGYILGVSRFDDGHFSMMTAPASLGTSACRHPGVAHHVCSWAGEMLSSEVVPCAGSNAFLVAANNGTFALIVSGQDVLAVERRSVSEHVDWLLTRERFEAAIVLVSTACGQQNSTEKCKICIECVRLLLDRKEYERAALIAQQVGVHDACEVAAWEEFVRLFDEAGELLRLVPSMPAPTRRDGGQDGTVGFAYASSSASHAAAPSDSFGSLCLPCRVYDTVLHRLSAVSPGALCVALDRWPSGVYSAGPLLESLHAALPSSITSALESSDGDTICVEPDAQSPCHLGVEPRRVAEALAALYEAQGENIRAARLLRRVGSSALFGLVTRQAAIDDSLRTAVCKDPGQLLDLCPARALKLFVELPDIFLSTGILELLQSRSMYWQYLYLRCMHRLRRGSSDASRKLFLDLTLKIEPHALCALLGQSSVWLTEDGRNVHQCDGETAQGGDQSDGFDDEERGVCGSLSSADVSALLVACRSAGVVDAEAALLVYEEKWSDAFRLLLRSLGDVEGVLHLLEEAPASLVAELRNALLKEVAGDSRAYSSLLARLASGHQQSGASLPPGLSPRSVVRHLPADLEIPRLGSKLAGALAAAASDRDVCSLTLGVLRNQAASQSLRVYQQQRRGRASAPRPRATEPEPTPKRGSSRDVSSQIALALRDIASDFAL